MRIVSVFVSRGGWIMSCSVFRAILAGLIVILGGPLTVAMLHANEPAAVRDSAAMAARVDDLIGEKLQQAGVDSAPPTSDAEFMRRAYLDLTGEIPTVNQAREFLSADDADRRAKLLDELLARPGHADHMATTWMAFLLPTGDLQRFGGGYQFENWLADKFADNENYDTIAREILLAQGQYNQQGPVLFYTALQLKPEELAAATSRAFLGVQIQCAQCHDHPFDEWSQRDFWGYAAFFAQLQKPANAQQRFVTQVADADTGDVTLPDTDEVVPASYLLGEEAKEGGGSTRREKLAAWMTSPDNPYFARAAVNRIWGQMFGRGLVDPVDDLGPHNKPSHPQLLDELADYFIRTNYDVRNLIKTLALTDAYGRSSISTSGDTDRPELFAHMAIKTLTAEQLYDCLAQATARRQGFRNQYSASGRNFNQARLAFLNKFRAPGGGSTEYQNGIPQALTLMNGAEVRGSTDLQQSDILVGLTAPFFTDEQRVETLFLATLTRPPNDDEREKFVAYVADREDTMDKRKALGDILWALLNSAEFSLNH